MPWHRHGPNMAKAHESSGFCAFYVIYYGSLPTRVIFFEKKLSFFWLVWIFVVSLHANYIVLQLASDY